MRVSRNEARGDVLATAASDEAKNATNGKKNKGLKMLTARKGVK